MLDCCVAKKMRQQLLLIIQLIVPLIVMFQVATSALRAPAVSIIRRSVVLDNSNKDNLLFQLVVPKDNKIIDDDHDDKNDNKNNKEKLPVVLFSSGADCPAETYSWLASKLAQRCHCCVVLSEFVQPFGGATTTVLLSHPFDMTKLNDLESYKEGPSTEGIQAILKEIRSLNDGSVGARNEQLLHDRLDLSRIILGGHSNGGRTVLDLLTFGNNRLFDPKTKVVGAFTYGASLVHFSTGFMKQGSIIPCDPNAFFGDTQAPPLLMMAGSNDLILSSGSSSNGDDATETVVRTIEEAFKKGGYKGNVDLIVLKGANHMLPTFPVPPCSGADRDGTLEEGFSEESYREVLGGIICDFVSGCLSDDSKGTATTANKKATKLNIPSRMFHFSKSYRHSDHGGTATKELEIVHKDQIMEEEAWKRLSSKLDSWIEVIKAELALEPSTNFNGRESMEWNSGSTAIFGCIEGWSSSKASWATRYSAQHSSGSQRSLGFNVWLSPSHFKMSKVPHLTLFCSVRAGKATIMADHLPRVDLAANPDYVETFYGGKSERLWRKIKQACTDNLLSTFTSADVTIRSVCGPNAVALSTNLGDSGDSVEVLVDVLDDHVENWLEFVRNAVDEGPFNVSKRDKIVRSVLRDHERRAGEKFMNPELAKSLADALAGFL